MAVIFSPLSDDAILDGPYKAHPRTAFLMLHDSDSITSYEKEIEDTCVSVLKSNDFESIKASTQRRTSDFLTKIIQLIRGCGIGVAIFTEDTPPKTLANIFFEVGLCYMLGKPVILVKSKGVNAPSDFIRTEWIEFNPKAKVSFKKGLSSSLKSIQELAEYFKDLGDIALDADEQVDFELAFERYKQAVLISFHKEAFVKIELIKDKIEDLKKYKNTLSTHETKLLKEIKEFIRLTPKVI